MRRDITDLAQQEQPGLETPRRQHLGEQIIRQRLAGLDMCRVVTLLHEFGHVLHHLLTEVDLPSIGGISGVEWDAVSRKRGRQTSIHAPPRLPARAWKSQ
jgi:hypothetical protein